MAKQQAHKKIKEAVGHNMSEQSPTKSVVVIYHVTFLLGIISALGTMTTSTVVPMLNWYNTNASKTLDGFVPDTFDMNVVNFVTFFIFLPVAIIARPIALSLSRWHMLAMITGLTYVSAFMQGFFGQSYWFLLGSAVITSFAEPFLMCNLLIWIEGRVKPKSETFVLSVMLTIGYSCGGLFYMVGLLWMNNASDIGQWFFLVSQTLAVTGFLSGGCCLAFYWFYATTEDSGRTVLVPSDVHGLPEPLDVLAVTPKRCNIDRFIFAAYIFTYALVDAAGLIVPIVMEQLFVEAGSSATEALISTVLYSVIPTLMCMPIGVAMDRCGHKQFTVFCIATVSVSVQLVGLIGIFYLAYTPAWLGAWLTLFGFGNTPSIVIFLSSIVKITKQPKSIVNQYSLWISSLFSAISVVVLLGGSSSAGSFGPILVGSTSVALGLLLSTNIRYLFPN